MAVESITETAMTWGTVSGTVLAGLFCGLSVFVHVQYSLHHVHFHR
jgi:hypothetical protein